MMTEKDFLDDMRHQHMEKTLRVNKPVTANQLVTCFADCWTDFKIWCKEMEFKTIKDLKERYY
jgi:hypothetical protein